MSARLTRSKMICGDFYEVYQGSFQFRREVPLWRIRLNIWWHRTALHRFLHASEVAEIEYLRDAKYERLIWADRLAQAGVCLCLPSTGRDMTCPVHGDDEYAWRRRKDERERRLEQVAP